MLDKIFRLRVNHSNKNGHLTAMLALCIGAYAFAMNFGFRQHSYLTFSVVDDTVPLLEGSVWVYIGYYLFLVGAYCAYEKITTLNVIFYSFIIVQLISFFIFMIFPTVYPIGFFPLSTEQSITNNVFNLIRYIDKPVNCFPSMHCANSYILAMGFALESKTKFFIAMTLANAIAVSTITTKQHYFADVWSGFFISLITFIVVYKYLKGTQDEQ